jgi:glycosyltransferase involved in cell wall biosynthesis
MNHDVDVAQLRLTVLLVTFNHEGFVRNALDRLFSQQFDGKIELIVADDCSTDGTLAIVKSFEGKDARFVIKYLASDKNLGITRNYERGFSACSGEYVAVLEGDDYWVSPFKLQRQMDFLDAHWECDLCSTNYLILDEGSSRFYTRTEVRSGFQLISARELISDNIVGNFSTCMYRRSALEKLPHELFELVSYDWIVNICVAMSSMIGFLEEPMSVYRLHSSGAWSNSSQTEKIKAQLAVIPAYDALTKNLYQDDFRQLTSKLKRMLVVNRFGRYIEPLASSKSFSSTGFADYLPPIFLILARALIPPKLVRLLTKIIKRDGT